MARPLRIEYPGAVYHVVNRGNQRTRVFHSVRHHQLFLTKLGLFASQFDVRVYGYCLMPNHFHLLLCTREPNLSRFMQSLLTSYTISANRSGGSAGHVFEGRFKAHLVEAQRYLSEVSRYTHLNPVRTAAALELDLGQRRAALYAFRWSSLPVLIGVQKAPAWMDLDPVLSTWGQGRAEQMHNYRAYVDQGLTDDLQNPFLTLAEQSILGSDSFVDTIKRKYLLARAVKDRGEEPALSHLVHSLAPLELAEVVAHICGVRTEELLKRRSHCREARRLLMYLTACYCRHRHTLSELARLLSVTVGGLSTARARVAQALASQADAKLQWRVDRALSAIRTRPCGQDAPLAEANS